MSLNEINKFLFLAPSLNLFESSNSKLLSSIYSSIQNLINENRLDDLLKILHQYHKSYSSFVPLNKNTNKVQPNIDAIIYFLACCSKLSKDEKFTHNGVDIFSF